MKVVIMVMICFFLVFVGALFRFLTPQPVLDSLASHRHHFYGCLALDVGLLQIFRCFPLFFFLFLSIILVSLLLLFDLLGAASWRVTSPTLVLVSARLLSLILSLNSSRSSWFLLQFGLSGNGVSSNLLFLGSLSYSSWSSSLLFRSR